MIDIRIEQYMMGGSKDSLLLVVETEDVKVTKRIDSFISRQGWKDVAGVLLTALSDVQGRVGVEEFNEYMLDYFPEIEETK